MPEGPDENGGDGVSDDIGALHDADVDGKIGAWFIIQFCALINKVIEAVVVDWGHEAADEAAQEDDCDCEIREADEEEHHWEEEVDVPSARSEEEDGAVADLPDVGVLERTEAQPQEEEGDAEWPHPGVAVLGGELGNDAQVGVADGSEQHP